jgi:hypothetical protein
VVFVALTNQGGREAAKAAAASGASLWVGSDVFTAKEQEQLRESGLSLTVFSYSLRALTPEALSDALPTIKEHHPDEAIFIEHI